MRDEPARLLLRIVVLTGVIVGAVVVVAKADAAWADVLAVGALVIAACAVGASLRSMMGAEEAPQAASGRVGVVALAAIPVIAVGLAIALPTQESAARTGGQPTAAGAAQTVRDFLAVAVLDNNAYAACQYLTPAEQQRLWAAAGGQETCREVLTATQPSFAGVHAEGGLHALPLRAVVRGATAYVTATPHGRRAATFVLRRTTPAEAGVYEAPSAAWRIDDGVGAVLGP
jgi:hypothetical protein